MIKYTYERRFAYLMNVAHDDLVSGTRISFNSPFRITYISLTFNTVHQSHTLAGTFGPLN